MIVEALIWDIGGILYKTPFEVFERMEDTNGWPRGSLPRGPFSPQGDADYARCSTGELSESEYWTAYEARAAELGYPIDLRTSLEWTDQLRPEVMSTIKRLQGSVRQATLSNDSSTWLGDEWWTTWPYRDLFDAVVDVKMLGIRKPHPETYLTVARRLNLEAKSCLFIDDMMVNIDGAAAVGMQTFFFDHTDAARSCDALVDWLAQCQIAGPAESAKQSSGAADL